MAFDEEGQAAVASEKVRICQRVYKLLTEEVGFPGRRHHLRPEYTYRRHRHRGAQQLRGRLHRGDAADQSHLSRRTRLGRRVEHIVFVSRQRHGARGDALGVSLSRGAGGLDMGIVNAGQLAVYEDIEPQLKELVEDVL